MDDAALHSLLRDVREGTLAPDDAAARLRRLPFADLGFARVDHHRALRQAVPEAVYGPGKTAAHCVEIVTELRTFGSPVVLTRASDEQVAAVLAAHGDGQVTSHAPAWSTVTWDGAPARPGRVLVVTAGTADLPAATECTAVLDALGFRPRVTADCGVAGVHRLLATVDELEGADAVVVVAGMEGALASVVGGVTAAPVVAVPTSAGYGAALEGVTALLAMLSSCAAGICVVGIDNGFGAACAVARMLS
ncbi:MAG TPA: nickel pincer cofactor biosynthesis protein LarB [Acidimicrobiales bacterium]|nr:nickel pincer cofactor biosynthesis protein LarB [Acidimicrobiales bacterium]